MKYSLKVRAVTALFLIAMFADIFLVGDVWAFRQNVRVKAGDTYVEFSGGEPLVKSGSVLVPALDLLDALGLKYGFTENDGELTVKLNGNTYVLRPDENLIYRNGEGISVERGMAIMDGRPYVPVRELCIMMGYKVSWDSQTYTVRMERGELPNPMDTAHKTDEYRLSRRIGAFNGYDVFAEGNDGGSEMFCMERVSMNEDKRSEYAEIVNSFAEAVPDANTYNIVAPTAAEFYASKEYETDYLWEISDIYSKLSDRVTPINVYGILAKNADKDIYFKTDHHWTQLGAYYAYKAFINYNGEAIDPAENFKTETIPMFQGSFIEYMSGTNGAELMKNTYDELLLFYPKSVFSGKAYFDADMTEYISDMVGINPNFRNYDCFLEGDYPVEVFKTDAGNGKKLCVVKESFGNAFAVWALNNYSEVYVIDYRCFNGYYNSSENSREFSISRFYENTKFDDLVIISYPVTVNGAEELKALKAMAR